MADIKVIISLIYDIVKVTILAHLQLTWALERRTWTRSHGIPPSCDLLLPWSRCCTPDMAQTSSFSTVSRPRSLRLQRFRCHLSTNQEYNTRNAFVIFGLDATVLHMLTILATSKGLCGIGRCKEYSSTSAVNTRMWYTIHCWRRFNAVWQTRERLSIMIFVFYVSREPLVSKTVAFKL